MSILAECPFCHRQQSARNKDCRECGTDLDKQKRNGKVRYYVTNRLNGKPKKKFVGFTSKEARAVDEKRRTQIREGRVREILPCEPTTFNALSDWFLSCMEEKIQKKEKARAKGKGRKGLGRSYQQRVMSALRTFNKVFGETLTSDITYAKLDQYMASREENISPYTLDVEMTIVKSMIREAFDQDEVDGSVFKIFRKVKNIAMPEDKNRKRVIFIDEYKKLLSVTQQPLRGMLVIGMVTGMRPSEIRALKWSYINR
jgi:integrase